MQNPSSASKPSDLSAVLPNAADRVVIFMVDDQQYEAELMRGFVEAEQDITLHSCTDHTKAVAQASQVRPTVILQDIAMPGTYGMTMVSRFRANAATKDTPIVVFSSNTDPKIKSLAFNVGANDYVEKSADRQEIIARLRYHSKAYLARVQRDEAYRALQDSREQLAESNESLLKTIQQLGEALSEIKQLTGLLPMCSYCKRVRDDQNYWSQIDAYLSNHSDLRLSHGICEECYDERAAELGLPTENATAIVARLRKKRASVAVIPPPASPES